MLLQCRLANGTSVLRGDIDLSVIFYCRPHAARKWDIDNLLKFVMDAGNRVLWDDDTQIVFVRASKKWDAANPRTEMEIAEIPRGEV